MRENGEIADRIKDAVVPFFVSNIHVYHVAALGVALEELRDYGVSYATSVVRNAKALADSLVAEGVDVLFHELGSTEGHQIIIDVGEKQDSLDFWNRLQEAGINTNAISLPFRQSFGLRIGAAEVTRRGFGADEMSRVAKYIARCKADDAPLKEIAREVAELSEQFSFIHFCRKPSPVIPAS